MSRDPILDLIDRTLDDAALGPDAVRYLPDAPEMPGVGALLLRCDGTMQPVTLPGAPHGNREAMYAAIGCTRVDVVRLAVGLDMWIDDEGLYTQPVNAPATALARCHGFTGPYHGPVVLTGGADAHGDTRPLTDRESRHVRAVVGLRMTPP